MLKVCRVKLSDCSKLIDEVLDVGHTVLETLSLSDGLEEDSSLGGSLGWVSWDLIPMVEDTLREGTTGSGRAGDGHEQWVDTWMKMPSGKWQCIASGSAPAKM